MQAFRRKAISLGARYVAGEVIAIAREGNRIAGVTLADGRRIGCGALVNAAGPWAGKVAAFAGVALPVVGRKRSVFVFRTPAELPGFPLLIDVTGAWCRPEGETFICGISPPEERDPDATDFEVVHAEFEETVWPAIAERVPALETLRLTGSWAGHYDYNTFDHNAVIGAHPEIGNLLFINGFSGHGIQQSPAAGRAVAELIAHGRYVTIDCSAFGYERIRDRRPLRELNVI
jgi:glycine/D-amino acid oxidase-like deaminating enzyme